MPIGVGPPMRVTERVQGGKGMMVVGMKKGGKGGAVGFPHRSIQWFAAASIAGWVSIGCWRQTQVSKRDPLKPHPTHE